MSETVSELSDKFLQWKEAFEITGLRVSLIKTKVMVNSGIIQDGMSKRKLNHVGSSS